MHAQIAQIIWNTDDNAIRSNVAKHRAERAFKKLNKCFKFVTTDASLKETGELGIPNHTDELLLDFKPSSKRILDPRPIPESMGIAFVCGFEPM